MVEPIRGDFVSPQGSLVGSAWWFPGQLWQTIEAVYVLVLVIAFTLLNHVENFLRHNMADQLQGLLF